MCRESDPATREHRGHQKMEERGRILPYRLLRVMAYGHVDFGLLTSRTVREYISFKPRSLWSFVMAAL